MNLVYYLPGYGGRLSTGLGEGLISRGQRVTGRETVGEFKGLSFQQQVDTIAEDLQSHFWDSDAHVVAVSFGAYLFLHAQAQMPAFIGSVLLLSPIVGEFSNQESGMNFIPPYSERLRQSAQEGRFTPPVRCEIHVGSMDWQSRPENVLAFAQSTGLRVNLVPDAGHNLGKQYVGPVLDRWLAQ